MSFISQRSLERLLRSRDLGNAKNVSSGRMFSAKKNQLTPRLTFGFLQQLHDVDVLVLDGFLATPVDAATVHQLLNILAGRERKVSTIVTSHFTPQEWYKSILDAVISESILNQLVSGAEIITLEGPNMRLTTNE